MAANKPLSGHSAFLQKRLAKGVSLVFTKRTKGVKYYINNAY